MDLEFIGLGLLVVLLLLLAIAVFLGMRVPDATALVQFQRLAATEDVKILASDVNSYWAEYELLINGQDRKRGRCQRSDGAIRCWFKE